MIVSNCSQLYLSLVPVSWLTKPIRELLLLAWIVTLVFGFRSDTPLPAPMSTVVKRSACAKCDRFTAGKTSKDKASLSSVIVWVSVILKELLVTVTDVSTTLT